MSLGRTMALGKTIRSIIFPVAFFVLLLASVVHALGLDEAKAKGVVGETASGYLAVVPGSSDPGAAALVNQINSLRKQEYQKIAKKNGTALQAVEKIGAKKAIDKTPSGQYVQRENGSWVKK